MTWPMITCSTWSGETSARSSAHSMTLPPRSVASREDRPPPSLPIGVRAAERMTVLGMPPRVDTIGNLTSPVGISDMVRFTMLRRLLHPALAIALLPVLVAGCGNDSRGGAASGGGSGSKVSLVAYSTPQEAYA